MKKSLTLKKKKGFTLIELVVVIAILGILAAILIPVISGFITRANEAADLANARMLYSTGAMVFTDPNLTYNAEDLATFNAITDDQNGVDIDVYVGTVWPTSRVDPDVVSVLTIEPDGTITVKVGGRTFNPNTGTMS